VQRHQAIGNEHRHPFRSESYAIFSCNCVTECLYAASLTEGNFLNVTENLRCCAGSDQIAAVRFLGIKYIIYLLQIMFI